MALYVNVIIDIDPSLCPLGIDIGGVKRSGRGFIEG